MKLAQNQVWQQGGRYFRIVQLSRPEVQYKQLEQLVGGQGTHHRVSKKEFCRMLKGATLLSADEEQEIRLRETPPLPPCEPHPEANPPQEQAP
jgi:hypothetical protein